MSDVEFFKKLQKIKRRILSQFSDPEARIYIRQIFTAMYKESLQVKSKVEGEKRLPDSFTPLAVWLSGSRWYWSLAADTRNLFIDYLDLDLEKN